MMKINVQRLPKNPMADGGEGLIYELDHNVLLKMYKPHIDKKEKEEKIKLLLGKTLPKEVVAPIECATDSNGRFIGYTMKKINGFEFKKLSHKKFVQVNKLTVKDILAILIKVKDTLKHLHQQQIFVGDLNESNILIDQQHNIHFIDVDSWSVGSYPCTVYTDSFKDPSLKGTQFSQKTDAYAFAVLVFKSLTRLHPFGGTTKPDMNLVERMKKKQSVIKHSNVTIPKNVNNWAFFPPTLVETLYSIFNENKRTLLDDELTHFFQSLSLCSTHQDYYFNKFNQCPSCHQQAKVIELPTKVTATQGIPITTILKNKDIQLVLNETMYLNQQQKIVHFPSSQSVSYQPHVKHAFSHDGKVVYQIFADRAEIIQNGQTSVLTKSYNSQVVIKDRSLYYVQPNLTFTQITVTNQGNASKSLASVAFRSHIQVDNHQHYFVSNHYDNMTILNINGYHYQMRTKMDVVNEHAYYDTVHQLWLWITENKKGEFQTIVFQNNHLLYDTTMLKFQQNLRHLCFNNGILFKAGEGFIRGFNYKTNQYKDFPCSICNEDSILLRTGKKFKVLNDTTIYEVG